MINKLILGDGKISKIIDWIKKLIEKRRIKKLKKQDPYIYE
jgi:hypothetical protein